MSHEEEGVKRRCGPGISCHHHQLPHTPALSPSAGEREDRRQSLVFPPLPRRGGEGWGEGQLVVLSECSPAGLPRRGKVTLQYSLPHLGWADSLDREEALLAAQHLRGAVALAEQILRSEVADCGVIGRFLVWHVTCMAGASRAARR